MCREEGPAPSRIGEQAHSRAARPAGLCNLAWQASRSSADGPRLVGGGVPLSLRAWARTGGVSRLGAPRIWLTSHLPLQWATSPKTCTPLLLYSRSQNTKTSFRDGGVGMGEGALHPQGPDPEARRPRPANREPANNSAVENWTVRNRQE